MLNDILFTVYIIPTFKSSNNSGEIFIFLWLPKLSEVHPVYISLDNQSFTVHEIVLKKISNKLCATCKAVRLWQPYVHSLMILLLLLIIHKYLLTTMYVVWNTALFYCVYWCLVTVCGIEALPHEELILLT